MMMLGPLVAALAFVSLASAASTDIVAQYQVYTVGKGEEVDVSLAGFSFSNKKYTYSLTGIPGEGKVHHPADVYCKFAYAPKKGTEVTITASASAPEVVGCNNPSVIYTYKANKALPTELPLGRFSYVATDASGAVSYPGVVHLVNGDRILAASFFNRNADGWTLTGNGVRLTTATWDMSSQGLMNRYVFGEEDSTDMVAGVDQSLWYFVAPPKFTGDMAAAYGGEFRFTISSAAGDFTKLTPNAYALKLECATCRSAASQDQGVQLYFPVSALSAPFDGAAKEFVVSLVETSGWMKDSENTQVAWAPPTQCEMVQVLKRLSGVHVFGDYTQGFESVAVDDVQLKAGPSMKIPLSCNNSMHFIY